MSGNGKLRPSNLFVVRAFVYAWLVISGVILLILVSPFVIREDALLAAGKFVQTPHATPCPLCGMTRAFISISAGDFVRARGYNANSMTLYLVFAFNELLAAVWIGKRNVHFHTRRPVHADA